MTKTTAQDVMERARACVERENDALALVLGRAEISDDDLKATRAVLRKLALVELNDMKIAPGFDLLADGSVGSAEIIDDGRHAGSAAYRSLALSARNAALLSSPLTLPPGRYDEVRDIVVNFNPRDALR